jgi:pimeloyl-ACP methyl ester carboxylesterase
VETTTTEPARIRAAGSYVDVDGVRTYYEVHGTGDPVVLLHGGMCTAETWDAQTSALAGRFQVYVPERFGHGRTPDIEGPITYENMARHTIAFMEAVGLDSAHLAGWSDGALVGLLVALRRPGLVRRLILIDQFVTVDGAPSWYQPFVASMTAGLVPAAMAQRYASLSPDGPGHFPVVFEKLHRIWTADTGVEVADLAHVSAPTLILAADGGAITLEHAADLRRALPVGQVAIVPGATHGLCMEQPHIVNQLMAEFLSDQQPPKMFAFTSGGEIR